MQTDPTTVTTTAACDLGRHQQCRKVVLSLTDAHLADCQCPCHGRVADLPDPWKAQAVLTPPCDQDADLDLPDDDELDRLLDLEGDRLLEDEAVGRWAW
jgi:hypothetical protein